MKSRIFKVFLPFVTVSCAVFLWWSVDNIAIRNDFSNWVLAFMLLFFSFSFFIFTFLFLENKKVIFSCIFVALFSSLFFSFAFSQLILIFLSMTISIWIHRSISNEKRVITKIEMFRVLRPVRFFLVLMASLIISGQFYNNVISYGIENLVPEIQFGKTEKRIVGSVISIFDQSLSSDDLGEMTVNEFILRKVDDLENSQQRRGVLESELVVDAALSRGAQDLSSMVGRQVSGEEKIFDIFSEVVNNRINEFFRTSIESEYLIFVPWTIFIMLFLMTFSVISFLMPFVVLFVKLLFAIIKKIGLIRIEKIRVEKEVIKL